MNVDLPPLGLLDLCAGIGRLGDAVHDGLAAVGLGCRVLAHVERDSAAAATLRLRMDAAELDHAPVCDDLAAFDGGRFAGRVAGVCAGLPCPAFSTAGKRVGNSDPRAWGEGFNPDDVATWGPIPHAIRIIAECRPGFVFFENVPGWVTSGAFEPVGRELFGLGFTRQAAVFVAAEDVGYPHGRERVFVLAISEQWRRWVHEQAGGPGRRIAAGRAGEELADGAGDGRQQRRAEPAGGEGRFDAAIVGVGLANPGSPRRERPERSGSFRDTRPSAPGSVAERGADVGDAAGIRPGRMHPEDGNRCRRVPNACERYLSLPLHPPPRGTDLAAVARVVGRSAAAEAEHAHDVRVVLARGSAARRYAAHACRLARRIWRDWSAVARMAPTLVPAIESGVPVVVDGHSFSHADLLRIGGNCVVADAAAVAFVELWREVVGGDCDCPRQPEGGARMTLITSTLEAKEKGTKQWLTTDA